MDALECSVEDPALDNFAVIDEDSDPQHCLNCYCDPFNPNIIRKYCSGKLIAEQDPAVDNYVRDPYPVIDHHPGMD